MPSRSPSRDGPATGWGCPSGLTRVRKSESASPRVSPLCECRPIRRSIGVAAANQSSGVDRMRYAPGRNNRDTAARRSRGMDGGMDGAMAVRHILRDHVPDSSGERHGGPSVELFVPTRARVSSIGQAPWRAIPSA